MVSFSRCVLVVAAAILAFSSSVTAQAAAGMSCVAGSTNTCGVGLACIANVCVPSSGLPAAGTQSGACLAGNTCNSGLSCVLGICTYTGGSGGLPTGSCLTTQCPTGTNCVLGICIPGGGIAAGGEGGACIGGTAGTCNAGLTCFFGICTGTVNTAGSYGGACLAGNTCNAGLACVANTCTFSLTPAAATCKSDADCGLRKCDKTTNTCGDWVIPALNCGGACPTGTNCRLGVCLPNMASTCVNACNSNNGESCVFGSCVVTTTPYCSSCSGRCVATANGPQCVASGAACAKTSDCAGTNQVCSFGSCQTVPPAVANFLNNGTIFGANVRDNIIAELTNIGASLAAITSVQAAADVKANINAGGYSAGAGAYIQLDSTVALQNLAFAGANAVARVEAGATQALTTLQATAAQAQLLVGVGAKTAAASLSVAVGASLAVSMGAAAAAASTTNSITQVAALALAGPLAIVGDINSIFTFPQNGSAVTVSNGASVKVSGGVCLTGNAGNAPISITASGNVQATARVSANQFFETVANVLGKTANFTIAGTAAFSSNVIEPAITLGSTAVVSFAARENSASATIAGDIMFDESATLSTAKLVINGTSAAGANLYFQVIRNCPLTAQITYNVQGSATVALANGFVLFNYAASTYANVNAFKCGIQVCGTDGCVAVTNPNNVALSGRRLLATGSQASFSPTSASVSSGSSTAVQAASQIKVASTVFALLVAFVVALIYQL